MTISVIILAIACQGEKTTSSIKTNNITPVAQTEETLEMVERLHKLVINGTPDLYYHWNGKLAEVLKEEMKKATNDTKHMEIWYQYVLQLLNSGKSKDCIREIENKLNKRNITYETLISRRWSPILEILALAYLRLGEQENCILNHNEYSCIIPIQKEALHTLQNGSRKAIEIYTMLYKHNPDHTYKWLINLAYMTLGEHPHKVPSSLLITFPNWNLEEQNFPEFKDIAASLGVNINGLSGGACIDDFNNDGLIDIFATSYGMQDQVKLFVNTGNGNFQDYTEASGMKGIVSGLNCIHADYDNDGDKDIFVLRGAWLRKGGEHPNSLLRNNGDGTFNDVTKSSGILSFHPTQTAAWADVNKDGFLDLFIGNEYVKGEGSHFCELYINQGDGSFLNKADEYGLGNVKGYVKGVAFGDINNDLWPDLYISVLGGDNMLFKNNKGEFQNISAQARIREPFFSFPCWFWDVNNDGFQDIFVSGYDARNMNDLASDYSKELQEITVTTNKPRLYINNGDNTFSNQTKAYALDKTMYAMGANFGDLDNDGFLDFYVGTGAPDLSTIVPNRMFRNEKGKLFKEVTSAGLFGAYTKRSWYWVCRY